ncbi:MAG: ribonuclease Z [bacterium]
MDFNFENNALIVTVPDAFSAMEIAKRLNELYHKLSDHNVILNLEHISSFNLEQCVELLQISNRHREASHSFVILNAHIDIDEVPDELIIVPTMQEAYDVIEMENMERDLGMEL